MSSDQRHTAEAGKQAAVLPPPPPGSGGGVMLGEPAWAIQRDAFPFDATRFQAPAVPYNVRRSPWRRGTVAVTEGGIVIEGMAADPQGRLTRITSWFSWAQLALWVLPWQWNYGSGRGRTLVMVRLILAGVAFVVSLALSLIAEYRRVAIREEIPWDQVLLVQFDRSGHVATLIREYPPDHPKKKPLRLALPMRLPGRGEAAEFRTVLHRYAPERVGDVTWSGYWSRRRLTFAILAVTAFVGYLIWVGVGIGKR